jgi:hypothetical protein
MSTVLGSCANHAPERIERLVGRSRTRRLPPLMDIRRVKNECLVEAHEVKLTEAIEARNEDSREFAVAWVAGKIGRSPKQPLQVAGKENASTVTFRVLLWVTEWNGPRRSLVVGSKAFFNDLGALVEGRNETRRETTDHTRGAYDRGDVECSEELECRVPTAAAVSVQSGVPHQLPAQPQAEEVVVPAETAAVGAHGAANAQS